MGSGRVAVRVGAGRRFFSVSTRRWEVLSTDELPERVHPLFSKSPAATSKLWNLTWPKEPRNILLVKKQNVPFVRTAMIELAKHIKNTYPKTNIILEPAVAHSTHHEFSFPVYTLPPPPASTPFPYTQSTYPRTPGDLINPYHTKTDLLVTLGGDGTILHAASLFSTSRQVPPVLSFAMGTLGFLGEWRWNEFVEAVRVVFEGAGRVLRRERLKVGVYDRDGKRVGGDWGEVQGIGDAHAMNEVNIHRGKDPHLAIVEVFVDGRFLTEGVADGMIISTPTGSTAYSLSSGGSIIHPSVSSLLITPICPRSLSFRPLVLPADSVLTLKLSERNRSDEVEVNVDGRRWGGIGRGEEIRVWSEDMRKEGGWGGIPCVRGGKGGGDDGWVGGLNGLLKFNHPFGEDE
ncbi:ATP-NAD kinase [Morchella conica CCBAS932]|uniref:ATP-NAD kinase n=1 Tax=Morchella conica CCBAS932 TaxID=1392247 RepID=A0A3N4L0L5_9PEZI|nr:ATP-NAD kinase [Morchella conica CCBAS932]